MNMQDLKEKLPQASMQIGWMEDDFRNLNLLSTHLIHIDVWGSFPFNEDTP